MAEQTYLDLPCAMAEEYMDSCFQKGPAHTDTLKIREKHCADPKWGKLFEHFADASDALKRAVSE